eukprot:5370549-Prymnesium_polylepis.1
MARRSMQRPGICLDAAWPPGMLWCRMATRHAWGKHGQACMGHGTGRVCERAHTGMAAAILGWRAAAILGWRAAAIL